MSPIHLLEGDVEDERDTRLAELEAELQATKNDLRRAQAVARDAQRNASEALAPLRRQLTPLYRALQSVFGELDAAGVDEGTSSTSTASPRVSAVWENWKAKLGPGPAKIIDALLLHGEMSATQLKIACACRQQTIYDNMSKLNKAGLVNKNAGRFSLKPL